MMMQEYGYSEEVQNKDGVKRARTTGQLRLWDMPTQALLKVMPQELGGASFPGLYILYKHGDKRVKLYVGETGNVLERLTQHISKPPKEIGGFERAVILNDARPTTQSDLSDAIVRQALESILIQMFQREGRYLALNKARQPPPLNVAQRSRINQYSDELYFILNKFGLLELPPPEDVSQEEIPRSDMRRLIEEKHHTVTKWSQYEGAIDGKSCFIRPGSRKPRGWQITLRDKFRTTIRDADAYLVVNRGNGP